MFQRPRFIVLFALFLIFGVLSLSRPRSALACGGLFCQNSPVDQNAERIIFTDNGDGTISALIQINYTGFAPDFSWILPLPNPITAADVAVPEDATAAFLELETATTPRFIAPPPPNCAIPDFDGLVFESAVPAGEVQIFASGEVGPYGFDVIGSEDPTALITWLRDNQYRVEEQMEPLINVYVSESFVFLAMRLLPDQGAQDIQPVQVTYASEKPMIPLRLTAVAANPNMAVITWFFANAQAVPQNYAHMEIEDEEIVFFTGGGNNYRQLLAERADVFNGQAFITEYAQPTSMSSFASPLLRELAARHRYLTRLNTVISPEEMTQDPVFEYDPGRENVDNVHDLSEWRGMYACEQDGLTVNLPYLGTVIGTTPTSPEARTANTVRQIVFGGTLVVGLVLLLVGLGVVIGRRL